LEPIEDPVWLRAFVEKLTRTHERGRAEPWNVSDAPAQYIGKQLNAIVGLKFAITRLAGKWKLSQNRPAQDRESVIDALFAQGTESSRAMAEAMEKVHNEID